MSRVCVCVCVCVCAFVCMFVLINLTSSIFDTKEETISNFQFSIHYLFIHALFSFLSEFCQSNNLHSKFVHVGLFWREPRQVELENQKKLLLWLHSFAYQVLHI